MHAAFDRRRRTIVDGLNAIEGVHSPGAFYAYPDATARQEPRAYAPDLRRARRIILERLRSPHSRRGIHPSGYLRLLRSERDTELGFVVLGQYAYSSSLTRLLKSTRKRFDVDKPVRNDQSTVTDVLPQNEVLAKYLKISLKTNEGFRILQM